MLPIALGSSHDDNDTADFAKRLGKVGDIVVVGTSETVGSMFELTRMDRVFPMFSTVEEALLAHV